MKDLEDIFANTVAVYTDEAGAAAFVAKERKFEVERNARVYCLLDGFDMSGWRALDVGCGYGRDVAEFRRRGAEGYGCDVSGPLLAQAEREVGPYFAMHDLRSTDELPFGGGFDLVWCCAVLVHIPRDELAAVLDKMWCALKVGGRLILITKSGEGEKVVENLGLPRIMVFYEMDEILRVLKRFGGEVELADDEHSKTAFGEALLAVRVRKPV